MRKYFRTNSFEKKIVFSSKASGSRTVAVGGGPPKIVWICAEAGVNGTEDLRALSCQGVHRIGFLSAGVSRGATSRVLVAASISAGAVIQVGSADLVFT